MSKRITIVIDGERVETEKGEILGYVLHDVMNKQLRATQKHGSPRGLFCGMGVCFDCLVCVDGRSGIRACLEPVRAGMQVETKA